MPEIKIDNNTSVLTEDKNQKQVTGLAKLAKAIINDDFDAIGKSLVDDILIPSFKNTFAALGKNFIDMLFFGEAKGNYGAGASNYHNSYTGSPNSRRSMDKDNRKPIMQEQGDWFIFASSAINSRGDAERILHKLNRILEEWGRVEVFQLYELVNETADYTWNNYGWYNLNEAKVNLGNVWSGSDYYIRLPKPIPIRRK